MTAPPDWTEADLPLAFARARPPRVVEVAVWLPCLIGGVALLVVAFEALDPGARPAWMNALPGGPRMGVGTLFGLSAFLIAAPFLLELLARRRWGSCTVFPDSLRFEASARNGGQDLLVTFGQLDARRIGRAGLLLSLRGEKPSHGWLHPLLIPTRDEAESARLVRLLDRLVPAPDRVEQVVLAPANPRLQGKLLVASLGPVCALTLFAAARSHAGWDPTILGFWVPLGLAMVGAGWLRRPFECELVEVRCLRASLLLGTRRIGAEELLQVGYDGERLALVVGSSGLLFRLPPETAARAPETLAWAGVTCPLGPLPEWAGPSARRGRLRWGIAGWAAANVAAAAVMLLT